MKNKFNALIVGAGNIGAFFDSPDQKEVLTHAHAFNNHENFNLVGFVDKDIDKAEKAANIWNCKSFKALEDSFKAHNIDILSVTVPDEYHYEVLEEISTFPVKLVFAEKPLAKTLQEAEKIIEIYEDKNIPVLINYSRRFVPEFHKIKENIDNGVYGKYITGTGYYGKGILHNGSHMIDLLRFLIGEIKDFETLDSINDFYDNDPSVSVKLRFNDNKTFMLNAIDCNSYTIFEADIVFEKGRIKLLNSGFLIEEYEVGNSKFFKGYKNLLLKNTYESSLGLSIYNAVDNIKEHLVDTKPLKCSINDGFKAMEISLKISEDLSK